MCQFKAGSNFKLKREKLERLDILFFQIRSFRDSTRARKAKRLNSVCQMVNVFIIDAVGRDDCSLAKLIHKRAVIAGLLR